MTDTMTADEFNALQAGKKKSKYSNIKTVIDGITFDSEAEAKRYGELKLMLDNGDIKDLTIQPRYPIVINGVKVCTYVADFAYMELVASEMENWWRVVEDVKGMRTPTYRLKKKLMKAVHGIDIVEV